MCAPTIGCTLPCGRSPSTAPRLRSRSNRRAGAFPDAGLWSIATRRGPSTHPPTPAKSANADAGIRPRVRDGPT